MALNGATSGNGVWKWIVGILAAIMLAGIPGIVQTFRTPSNTEFTIVRERQQIVLQRLAVIESQILVLQQQIHELQLELRQHETATQRR